MSKVYEALRKAEQERLSHKEPASADNARVAERPAAESLVEETRDADIPLPHADLEPAADTVPANGKAGTGPLPSDDEAARAALREATLLAPLAEDRIQSEQIPPLVGRGHRAAIASEQFQVLRAFMEDWVAEHGKRVFVVTSALRREGKSFVAINLATSLASAETPVILVDADCRAPSIHRAFNLTPLAGLLTYLEKRAELADCLHDTHIAGLRVLPAGGISLGTPEAFAGSRMRRLLEELRAITPAPYVIFDAPAVVAAPETRILARLADAGLLVVAANVTPRKLVAQTIEMLRPLEFCGVAFNRFEPPYSVARTINYKYGYPNGRDGADRNGRGAMPFNPFRG